MLHFASSKLLPTFRRYFRFINARNLSKDSVLPQNYNNPVDNTIIADEEYEQLAKDYLRSEKDYNCFIIHPYIKWGSKKIRDINPERQLDEAVSLVRTLGTWKIHAATTVALENFNKKELFGKGTLEKFRLNIRRNSSITAVFLNTSNAKLSQIEELEKAFAVPIFDRYKIVMQILRMHAISKHAKLQVALAEIPYLWSRIMKHDSKFTVGIDYDTKKLMLQNREGKIKDEINKLRTQRQLLRKKRKEINFPVIAVVGYTNAGKTSVIKALTGDPKLVPRNQLFATLDVTVHAGVLPNNLQVLYVDTVGFISDIPTNLIECFVATLEDALFADIILHVEDISHGDYLFQRQHVLSTLQQLADKTDTKDMLQKIITVGNKCDISPVQDFPGLKISATQNMGLEKLQEVLCKSIIKHTGRLSMTMRIPIGGNEIRWLYKNAAVTGVEVDERNSQLQKVRVVITRTNLDIFKHQFIKL